VNQQIVGSGRREQGLAQGSEKVNFGDDFLGLLLLFGLFALGHHETDFAGMSTIEGFDDRLFDRAVLGVFENHSDPGDRLQHGPLSANREDQRADNQPFSELAHDAFVLTWRVGVVKYGTHFIRALCEAVV
jgi:hypothetical protein